MLGNLKKLALPMSFIFSGFIGWTIDIPFEFFAFGIGNPNIPKALTFLLSHAIFA